jgi:hypothetical protein
VLRTALVGLLFVVTGLLLSTAAHAQPTPCPATPPYAPQPAPDDELLEATVRLHWRTACAVSVEVRVNGSLIATLDAAATTYTISVAPGVTTWQITAVDRAGKRINGPVWRFTRDADQWLATPHPMPTLTLLYAPTPTPRLLLQINSIPAFVAVSCGLISGGLGLVIGAAWWLGVRAQHREQQRERAGRWLK